MGSPLILDGHCCRGVAILTLRGLTATFGRLDYEGYSELGTERRLADSPNLVLAESGSAPSASAVFAGLDSVRGRFSQIMFASGGMGASAHADGHSCTS